MNPLRVRASNYRTFASIDLDLPAGCVGVLGHNGAGKSSIVNAIDLALFGPEGRSWQPYLTVGEETELMVELEFEHAGALYRVRRGYSAKGAGKSTLDLEKQWSSSTTNGRGLTASTAHAAGWEALTLGSAKETQALLEQLLGFSRRTFGASSFLRQSDGGAFCEADPRDRKRILADALGLDRFEQLLAAVRRDRRAAEQETARIDGRLAGATRERLAAERGFEEQEIARLTEQETAAGARLASAEHELGKLAEQIDTARRAESDRATAVAQRDAAAAALAAKTRLRENAAIAGPQLEQAKEELRTLPTAEQLAEYERQEQELAGKQRAYEDAVREHEQTVKMAALRAAEKKTIEAQAAATHERMLELDRNIAHIELGELDSCPTCEQQLGVEARKATVGSLRAQAQTLADEAEALFERAAAIEIPDTPAEPVLEPGLPVALAAVRELLRAAREAEVQRGRLTERVAQLHELVAAAASPEYVAELEVCEAALRAADAAVAVLPAPVDVGSLEAAAVASRGRVEVARSEQAAAARDRAIHEERLAQLTARSEQLEQDLAAREQLQAEIDLLAILERAYGPDGIPALIVENAAIPSIEVEANRILVALGGTTAGCRVELRTDRAKKDGNVRDDVLDVVVVTEAGERPYETFSGGERTRLNLALRIALARLLATRRGAESRVLAIDEPEFLDEDGTAALVDVLRELEQQSVFDRVYLVSHVPALRDSFDVVLNVVKDETGRSHVAGALEAVAA